MTLRGAQNREPSGTRVASVTASPANPEVDLSQLINDMRDLKLFMLQGQNLNHRNNVGKQKLQTPPYVICHGCGGRGHLKYECPEAGKKSSSMSDHKGKVAEVALLEFHNDKGDELEAEVMMAKRGRPSSDEVDLHRRSRKKRLKDIEGSPRRKGAWKPQRKIGMSDMGISRGQPEYNLSAMLGRQNANITIGQLLAKCPALRRELRASVSTRKKKEVAVVDAYKSKSNLDDTHSLTAT
jgi:hypothetical protein